MYEIQKLGIKLLCRPLEKLTSVCINIVIFYFLENERKQQNIVILCY